jgi:hypothetical protein
MVRIEVSFCVMFTSLDKKNSRCKWELLHGGVHPQLQPEIVQFNAQSKLPKTEKKVFFNFKIEITLKDYPMYL